MLQRSRMRGAVWGAVAGVVACAAGFFWFFSSFTPTVFTVPSSPSYSSPLPLSSVSSASQTKVLVPAASRADDAFSHRDAPAAFNHTAFLDAIHSKYQWADRTPEQSKEAWLSELPEQLLIAMFLPDGAVVLEIGGNIGRATIVACEKVGTKGLVVSAELTKENRDRISALGKEFVDSGRLKVVPAISDEPLFQQSWFSSSKKATPRFIASIYKDMKDENWKQMETLSVASTLALVPGLSVIIADCEGCFYALVSKRPDILQGVKMIIMENDGNQLELPTFRARLVELGFSLSSAIPKNVCPNSGQSCFFSVYIRE